MWNVLEHSFAFYRRNNGPSNGKSLASHDFEEHHIANGDVSMQGKNIGRKTNMRWRHNPYKTQVAQSHLYVQITAGQSIQVWPLNDYKWNNKI